MVATACSRQQGLKTFRGGSKNCKLRMRVKFNFLVQTNILPWFLASPTYSHLGTVSHTGVESGFSRLWYRVRVVQTTLQALFRSTITGVVVQGFRCSSVPVTHKSYLVESRRPPWFGSSQANRSVFNTLSRHSPLAAVSRSTSIISLSFGSSASLSSPLLSFCYVASHCSAFLSC